MKISEQASPYHLFKGIQYLVPEEFERKFSQINNENQLFSEFGWSESTRQKGLFIDLSQVRWVDFGVAAQLVLLIESAKKQDIRIAIAMPLIKLSRNEQRKLSDLNKTQDVEYQKMSTIFENLRNLREMAKGYLGNIQFQRAAECPHVKKGVVRFIDEYDFESDISIGSATNIISNSVNEVTKNIKKPEDMGYKFLVPLTWVNSKKHNHSLDFIEEKFTEILSQPERGLDAIDALAIKNVIINELLKNVKEHSGCDDALLGVALQPSYVLESEYYFSCENTFVEWLKNNNTNYISIFFGDTGYGLCKTLESAFISNNLSAQKSNTNIIQWAFDKWSTSKTKEIIRGTKGLYRIQRIINKYNGLIMIRTGYEYAGFQKGGNASSSFVSNLRDAKGKSSISLVPGTFLRMLFSPFKELNKFSITTHNLSATSQQNYKWDTITIQLNSTDPKSTFSGDLSIRNLFGERKKNILILVDSRNSILSGDEIETSIKNHLLFLSEARHPNGVVIYGLPGGWENVDGIINSVNSEIQERRIAKDITPEAVHPDKEDIYDPVLILGENRQYSWVGDDEDVISCLNELYSSLEPKRSLTSLMTYNQLKPANQTRVLQYFLGDDAVIKMDVGNLLRFNFNDLKTHFSEKLKLELNETIEKQNVVGNYYVTPNLRNVKYWVSIEKLIKNDLQGYAFALSAALKEIYTDLPDALNHFKVLIDNNDSLHLAIEFCRWLGIPNKNIIIFNDEVDGRLPRRNPIFEETDKVIILTTIISTKETARRSLKTVLRDLAKPVAVLGIINQGADEPIVAWGRQIPTISLINNINYEIDQEEILRNQLNPIYKTPYGYFDEIEDNSITNDQHETESILEFITDQGALHFSHFGKANNRHFTFFLSASRLSNDEEKTEEYIYSKFYNRIEEWLGSINGKQFDIWRSTPDFKISNPSNKITERISKYFSDGRRKYSFQSVVEIKRASNFGHWNLIPPHAYSRPPSENVVIIDWGSLTGNTIQQMINLAAGDGRKNILVCILFSQLPIKEESFFSSIKEVKGTPRTRTTTLFPENSTEEISSRVSVNFFYRLPLHNYESADCPVCENIHSLREFEIRGELMSDFYSKRRERLKIKDKDKTDLPPQDFYANGDIYLEPEIILKMFKFRIMLQEALVSTIKRKDVEKFLFKLMSNIKSERKRQFSEIYAVLYFLSVEIMWMQKPPLVFLNVRKYLTAIAQNIAILPMDEANKIFSNEALAVRYKFAAISVLRSSDKNQFNSSLYKIFIGSRKDNAFSYSLTQNLFFHTYSFLKRPYHTSIEQIKVIRDNIEKILNEPNTDLKLKNAIVYLKFYADKRKFEVSIPSNTIMSIFQSFKKQIRENYGNSYKHNNVCDDFVEVKPVDYEPALKKHFELKSPPEKYKEIFESSGFLRWLSNLDKRWADVADYLNNVVITHIEKLDILTNSNIFASANTSFTSFIKQMISEKKLFGVSDDLTTKINEIIADPMILSNRNFFDAFASTWRFYYDNFIFVNQSSPFLSCPLVKISEQIPCKIGYALENAISIVKKKAISENVDIVIKQMGVTDKFLFFPHNQLKHFFDQILVYNLFTHHIKGQQVNVFTHIQDNGESNYVTLVVVNSGTQPRTSNKGGMHKFQTEFLLYGGQLTYQFLPNQKQFKITAKFKIWNDE